MSDHLLRPSRDADPSFPASLFDWSITDLSYIPMIVDHEIVGHRWRFETTVDGFDHCAESELMVEVKAWTSYFANRGLPVPSVTGLVLDRCPGCNKFGLQPSHERAHPGVLTCRMCPWTELGPRFQNHSHATCCPWPDTVEVSAGGTSVWAWHVRARGDKGPFGGAACHGRGVP